MSASGLTRLSERRAMRMFFDRGIRHHDKTAVTRQERSLGRRRRRAESDPYATFSKPLFDHLISTGEQQGRHGQTERFGGLKIDYKLELGRLQHREVCRSDAFQYPSGIDASLSIHVRDIDAIAHQT